MDYIVLFVIGFFVYFIYKGYAEASRENENTQKKSTKLFFDLSADVEGASEQAQKVIRKSS